MARGQDHQLDSQPLLGNDDAPLDTRFALDDETAYEDDLEDQLAAAPGDGVDAGNLLQQHSQEAPKYPPSSLPPTYTDSVRYRTNPSMVGHRFPVLEEHIRHFTSRTKEFLSRMPGPSSARVCYARVCPSTRFAQAGLLIAGLWLLVVLTGPAMEPPESNDGQGPNADNIWSIDNSVFSSTGPPPILGDGHIVDHPAWKFHACQSEKIAKSSDDAAAENSIIRLFDWIRPSHRVVCRSTTSVALRAPISFTTTDKVFLFIDPVREHAKRRGRVPAKVTLVVDDTLPLHVPKKDSRAEGRLVPRYRIGKQGHSDTEIIVDIEARYQREAEEIFHSATIAKMGAAVFDEGVGIYTWQLPPALQLRQDEDAPLFFNIKVRIPAGADVPAFHVDGSAVEFDAFSQVKPDAKDTDQPTSVRFGSFNLLTGRGNIISNSIHAISHVRLWTGTGSVQLMPSAHLSAPSIQMTSRGGSISIGRNASVSGWGEAVFKTTNGDIHLDPGSSVAATKILAKAHRGGFAPAAFESEVSGKWIANYSLDLSCDNAAAFVRVDVRKPQALLLTPEDRRAFVRVDVKSDVGDIDVRYVEHERGVPLHSEIEAKTVGRVDVKHVREFEGNWSVEGWSGSHAEGPQSNSGRIYKVDGKKEKGKSKEAGAGHSYVKGHVALVPSSTPAEGNATSNARSAGGVAVLYFD